MTSDSSYVALIARDFYPTQGQQLKNAQLGTLADVLKL